jgi:hypothetical protein
VSRSSPAAFADGDLVAERCARTRGVRVAAEKQVKESVRLPLLSHRDDVERLRVLLEQPIEAGVASLGSCSSGQASVHLLGADSVIEGDGGTTCLIPPRGSPGAIRPGG